LDHDRFLSFLARHPTGILLLRERSRFAVEHLREGCLSIGNRLADRIPLLELNREGDVVLYRYQCQSPVQWGKRQRVGFLVLRGEVDCQLLIGRSGEEERTAVMIPPVRPSKQWSLPAMFGSQDQDTGLALVNPGSVEANVRLEFMDSSGQCLADVSAISLPPGGKRDLLLSAFGKSHGVSAFEGMVKVRADQSIAIAAIRVSGHRFEPIRVNQPAAIRGNLWVFAHYLSDWEHVSWLRLENRGLKMLNIQVEVHPLALDNGSVAGQRPPSPQKMMIRLAPRDIRRMPIGVDDR
jgi:hypothetical protein